MSTFKEQVLKDIDDVFADTDEFFEEHVVNGRKMPVMVDGNENAERTKFQKAYHEGNKAKKLLIYVKASDFGRLPAHGNRIVIDGSEFLVSDAINETGLYSITMEASG
jgi:hypothetical protein